MAVKFLRIAKFIAGNKIVDILTGNPTTQHLRQLNDMAANFEKAANALASQQADIIATLEQAGIALTTAEAARDLVIAQGKSASLIASYVDPSGVLTAEIDPADSTKAKINIAAHTRKYGDGTSVSVAAGSVSGLLQNTDYYITYMDTAFAGGTVTYVAQSSYLLAAQDNPSGQHTVGDIVTPSAGEPPTTGGDVRPPGTYCVVEDSMILMANEDLDGPGEEKRAADIEIGDMVWTRHEISQRWGAYPVCYHQLINREIYRAERFPDATAEHPFWLSGSWVLMGDIGVPAGRAVVAHMTINDAHTFVARHPDQRLGFLSHNKTVNYDIP